MHETRLRVLLVDDDEEDYLITSGIISEIPGPGFQVTWRDSYKAALEALALAEYDVLVFDYRLGAETGIDLLKEVRARNYEAPVILLTGQQDSDIDNEAIRLGAADYLIKGKISPDSFERSVRHAIEQQRILAQLHTSNAFLQSIIDALSSEVAILDAHGSILTVNQAWQRLAGTDGAATIGVNYLHACENMPEEERDSAREFADGVRQVTLGEVDTFSMERPLSANGQCRWVQGRVSSFESRGTIFVVVAYSDITVRKFAQMQLEKSRAQLEELSIRDELTSLYNRRYFNITVKQEIERSHRYKKNFAIIMLDIDRFKSINDTYGHHAGDDALKNVARICSDGCRTVDCVSRFGGEELVFIVPESEAPFAIQFAERIRKRIESQPITVTADSGQRVDLTVTASFGVAIYPQCGETIEALCACADKGLYAAKTGGRNQVQYIAA